MSRALEDILFGDLNPKAQAMTRAVSVAPRTCAQQCKIGCAKNDQLAELLAVGVGKCNAQSHMGTCCEASKDLATERLL